MFSGAGLDYASNIVEEGLDIQFPQKVEEKEDREMSVDIEFQHDVDIYSYSCKKCCFRGVTGVVEQRLYS